MKLVVLDFQSWFDLSTGFALWLKALVNRSSMPMSWHISTISCEVNALPRSAMMHAGKEYRLKISEVNSLVTSCAEVVRQGRSSTQLENKHLHDRMYLYPSISGYKGPM